MHKLKNVKYLEIYQPYAMFTQGANDYDEDWVLFIKESTNIIKNFANSNHRL